MEYRSKKGNSSEPFHRFLSIFLHLIYLVSMLQCKILQRYYVASLCNSSTSPHRTPAASHPIPIRNAGYRSLVISEIISGRRFRTPPPQAEAAAALRLQRCQPSVPDEKGSVTHIGMRNTAARIPSIVEKRGDQSAEQFEEVFY